MPSKREVFWFADQSRARGVRMSLSNVIQELRSGGSNREVGPLLRDWKVERSYRPTLDLRGLPERVQARFTAASVELWEAVRVEARAELVADRERLDAERRPGAKVLDEALARLG